MGKVIDFGPRRHDAAFGGQAHLSSEFNLAEWLAALHKTGLSEKAKKNLTEDLNKMALAHKAIMDEAWKGAVVVFFILVGCVGVVACICLDIAGEFALANVALVIAGSLVLVAAFLYITLQRLLLKAGLAENAFWRHYVGELENKLNGE